MAFSIRTEGRRLVALGLGLVLTLAGEVRAQTTPDDVEATARAAAADGRTAFDAGDYPRAIARYEEAYRLKVAPALLFNLGQSHRRAGHLERATFYFGRYLETDPPEAQAKIVATLLLELKVERGRADAAQQVELAQTRLALAQAETVALNRRLDLERALKEKPAAAPPLVTRWWFWGALGVITVGATIAVIAATAPQPSPTTLPPINAR